MGLRPPFLWTMRRSPAGGSEAGAGPLCSAWFGLRPRGHILKHLGLWELTPRPPPRSAKSQSLPTEPHIDYSHRGVGPYGPEADSQVPPTDNGFYVDPILAFFRSKRRLSVNRGVAPPCVHSGPYQLGCPGPPQSSSPQHPVPGFSLTPKGQSPHTPGQLKRVSITSPSPHRTILNLRSSLMNAKGIRRS